jgi:hypothetical protein
VKTLGTLAAIAAFAGIVAWAMAQQGQVHCEVCVTYKGQTGCKTVTAPTAEDALAFARSGVCGEISGSMTRDLECMRTQPISSSCEE